MFSALSLESRSCILQAVEIPSETNSHFDWLITKDLLLSEQMMIYYLKEMKQAVSIEMCLMTQQQRKDLHTCKRICSALNGIICIEMQAEINNLFTFELFFRVIMLTFSAQGDTSGFKFSVNSAQK